MWLMTTLGFFSVVCAKKGDGGAGKPMDKTRVMIRARVKQHLDSLKRRFPDELGEAEILEMTAADYRWRIICPKAVWAECVKVLVEDLAYGNFKSACAKIHGASSPYLDALHETWETFDRIKDR